MSDQCKNCTFRGDYEACTKAECFRHESWIDLQRIKRIKKLETALKLAKDSTFTMWQAGVYQLNALDTKMAKGIIESITVALKINPDADE